MMIAVVARHHRDPEIENAPPAAHSCLLRPAAEGWTVTAQGSLSIDPQKRTIIILFVLIAVLGLLLLLLFLRVVSAGTSLLLFGGGGVWHSVMPGVICGGKAGHGCCQGHQGKYAEHGGFHGSFSFVRFLKCMKSLADERAHQKAAAFFHHAKLEKRLIIPVTGEEYFLEKRE